MLLAVVDEVAQDRFISVIVIASIFWWVMTCISCVVVAKVRGVGSGGIVGVGAVAMFAGPVIGIIASLAWESESGEDPHNFTKVTVALLPSLLSFAGGVIGAIASMPQ